jgi:hypothetical protein
MKKAIALAVPLVVVVLVTVAVAVLETRRGPDWRRELEEYVAHSVAATDTVAIRAVAEARRPWEFDAEMGAAVREDWRWQSIELTYPPTAVQCVLLERSQESTAVTAEWRHRVVFMAHHTDGLYRVGWVVHEGPRDPFERELLARLDAMGCDLGLE